MLEKQGSQNCFFPNGVWRAVWKKRFCPTYFARVFWSDLKYILSDIQVGHFQYTYRTNYGLNKLKKHGSQNE